VIENRTTVEMTEEGKSQKQTTRFSFFLGKRKQRVSHIPTAATAAMGKNKKGTFLKSLDKECKYLLTDV